LGSLTGFIKASAGVLTTSLIDLSTDVSSTLPVSHGGTGSTSLTGLLKGNGTGGLLTATDGTDYISASTFGGSFYSYFNATTTDALTEGTSNKYYTDVRARSALSAAYPIQYNTGSGAFSLAFGTSTSNTWGGTQTFTNAPVLGSLTGVIYGNSGSLAAVATSSATLSLGLTGSITGIGAGQSLSIATTSLYSGSTGQFPYFSGINTISATSSIFLASSGNVGIGTTSPFSKFSLAGNAYLGGNLTATGSVAFTSLSSGLVKSTSGALSIALDGTDYLSPSAFDTRLSATTSLPNLTTLATLSTVGTITSGTWHGGVIGQAYGGTGISSYVAGDVLYADNTGTLVKLPAGSNGAVLKLQAGLPAWGVDETVGGGGSDGIFATSSGRIYPLDTSEVLLVGTNATATPNSIFEVNGQQYISSKLGIATTSPSAQLSVTGSGLISGTLTAGNFIDTGLSTNALVYVNGSKQLATTTISAPLTFSSGTLSISQAGASTDGYLSSTDWNTFNSKQAALTFTYPLVNTTNTI
jgi:hypothetical protein